jgi:hypothetical protein
MKVTKDSMFHYLESYLDHKMTIPVIYDWKYYFFFYKTLDKYPYMFLFHLLSITPRELSINVEVNILTYKHIEANLKNRKM